MDGKEREMAMLDERFEALERRQDEMEKKFSEAFPASDHLGHCRYHHLMIEQIEERRRLRRAVQEKTIAGLVWAGVLALGLAVWQWLKTQLRG